MVYKVSRYIEELTRATGGLDREHWIAISVLVLFIGLVCMRGFGSRTNY